MQQTGTRKLTAKGERWAHMRNSHCEVELRKASERGIGSKLFSQGC